MKLYALRRKDDGLLWNFVGGVWGEIDLTAAQVDYLTPNMSVALYELNFMRTFDNISAELVTYRLIEEKR